MARGEGCSPPSFGDLRVVEQGHVSFTVDRITDDECKYKGGKQSVRLQEREVKLCPLDCSFLFEVEKDLPFCLYLFYAVFQSYLFSYFYEHFYGYFFLYSCIFLVITHLIVFSHIIEFTEQKMHRDVCI